MFVQCVICSIADGGDGSDGEKIYYEFVELWDGVMSCHSK